MPLARSRASIAREAGRASGKPGYMVKKPPLATLPADPEEPLITSVVQDVLHMRCRIGERITGKGVDACAKHTGDKFAAGFQSLVRLTGVPFEIYEKQSRGKAEIKFSSLIGRHWRTVLQKIGPIIRSSTGVFFGQEERRIRGPVRVILLHPHVCGPMSARKCRGTCLSDKHLDKKIHLHGVESQAVCPFLQHSLANERQTSWTSGPFQR